MGLNCLWETLAFTRPNMKIHNGIADPPKNGTGSSAKLLARVVILN